MGLRNADAEPTVGSHRTIKLFGELPIAVALEPIIVAEARADLFDCGAHRLRKLSGGEVDAFCSGNKYWLRSLRRLNRRRVDEAAGLAPPQRGVVAILGEQIAMRALLDDAALVEHDEAIHLRDG